MSSLHLTIGAGCLNILSVPLMVCMYRVEHGPLELPHIIENLLPAIFFILIGSAFVVSLFATREGGWGLVSILNIGYAVCSGYFVRTIHEGR